MEENDNTFLNGWLNATNEILSGIRSGGVNSPPKVGIAADELQDVIDSITIDANDLDISDNTVQVDPRYDAGMWTTTKATPINDCIEERAREIAKERNVQIEKICDFIMEVMMLPNLPEELKIRAQEILDEHYDKSEESDE